MPKHHAAAGRAGRRYTRSNPHEPPTIEEQHGGLTSLGQNRILAARSVVECPRDIVVDQVGSTDADSNYTMMMALGLVVVALVLMRQTA